MFNPIADFSHTFPTLLFTVINVTWHLKKSARRCCDFSFRYLKKSPPLSQADTKPNNCFSLWWMDIKKKKSIFFYIKQLREQRQWACHLQYTCNRQSCRGYNDNASLLWTDLTIACLHEISIPSRLQEEELCFLISLVFHYNLFHLLLTFFWDEPLLL